MHDVRYRWSLKNVTTEAKFKQRPKFDFHGFLIQIPESRGERRALIQPVQGSTKRRSPGLVNFVAALAYRFCLALPVAFTQPGDQLLVVPCSAAAAVRACEGGGGEQAKASRLTLH